MTEFTSKIDRLVERLRRCTTQCDLIEERACLGEEHLTTLNDQNQLLANLLMKQFFYRLENYLHRTITDQDKRLAYVKALSLVRKSSILSSLFLKIIQRRKNDRETKQYH